MDQTDSPVASSLDKGCSRLGVDSCDPGRGLGGERHPQVSRWGHRDPLHLHIKTRKSEPWFTVPSTRIPEMFRKGIRIHVCKSTRFVCCLSLAGNPGPQFAGQEGG